jgi:hypothetical protein
MVKRGLKKRILILFTILAFVLVGIATFNGGAYSAQAGLDSCKDMGLGMSPKSVVLYNINHADKANTRKWNVQELFGNSLRFTAYYGEGPGTWLYANKENRGEERAKEFFGGEGAIWSSQEVQDKLLTARNGGCSFLGFKSLAGNVTLALTNGIVSITGEILNFAFGNTKAEDIIIKLVGGTENSTEQGLITTFLNSLYMPMVIIAVLILAITIMYKGLFQRKLRESFMDILWSFGAVVIGLVLMYNPQMLARAPQTVVSQVSSCMIGAITGQNCLTTNVMPPSSLAGYECKTDILGVNDTSSILKSMNCTIWKSFVLELWAEEQFGEPYNNLYTTMENAPDNAKIWSALEEGTGDKYCVSLGTTKKPIEQVGTFTTSVGEYKVCNAAIYQLYLMTNMNDTTNALSSPNKTPWEFGTYDARWYDIILPMANNGAHWRDWSEVNPLDRWGSSLMGLFAATMASFVLVSFSILGAVYKLTGVIMMAFAPLFFLFAIEPTRGKKIFLGWLEVVVSSILKYAAITMLIIVSLTMYSALLSNTSGLASFVSVIIITVAMSMYRKEIVDLIGATNMGGQKLSNKLAESLEKAKKGAGKLAGATVGGAIGANVATRMERKKTMDALKDSAERFEQNAKSATSVEEEEMYTELAEGMKTKLKKMKTDKSDITAATKEGAKDSTKRILRRGTGTAAMAFAQASRTEKELEKKEAERQVVLKNYEESKLAEINNPKENQDNGDNTPTPPTAPIGNGGEKRISVDTLRDNVEYEGRLSPEEKDALDKFADQITKLSDEELMGTGDNQETLADINKKKLVAGEINARIKANSINNNFSGDLSRHSLANHENLSEEEIEFNASFYKDNFIETGNQEDLEKFKKFETSRAAAIGDDKKVDVVFEAAKLERELVEKGEKEVKRTTPTKENLVKSPVEISEPLRLSESLESMKREIVKEQEVKLPELDTITKPSVEPKTPTLELPNLDELDKPQRETSKKPSSQEYKVPEERRQSDFSRETPEQPKINTPEQTNVKSTEQPRVSPTEQAKEENTKEKPRVNQEYKIPEERRQSDFSREIPEQPKINTPEQPKASPSGKTRVNAPEQHKMEDTKEKARVNIEKPTKETPAFERTTEPKKQEEVQREILTQEPLSAPELPPLLDVLEEEVDDWGDEGLSRSEDTPDNEDLNN